MVAQGTREARLAWQVRLPEATIQSGGHYVAPAIFTEVRPKAVIAREEIFGPGARRVEGA